MKPSTKRILSIAFAALFFIATLIVYGNLIQPEAQVIDTMRSEVASKQQLFAVQKAAVGQVQSLISQFQNSASLRSAVAMIIPSSPDVAGALNQFNAVARNNQVQITGFSVKPKELQTSGQALVKGMGVFTITMKAIGSYAGLKGFLRSIETNIRLANAEDVSLTAPQNQAQSSAPVYQMDITVDIYYQAS